MDSQKIALRELEGSSEISGPLFCAIHAEHLKKDDGIGLFCAESLPDQKVQFLFGSASAGQIIQIPKKRAGRFFPDQNIRRREHPGLT